MCTGEGKLLMTKSHQSTAQHHMYLRASKELTELGPSTVFKDSVAKSKCS